MNLVLGSFAGFFALTGVPIVLLIYMLQRRAKSQLISTLFLLAETKPVNERGRLIERLRSSLPLFLHLVIIALLAWLLCAPRTMHPDSVQRVVLIMDTSYSMDAFMPIAQERLISRAREFERAAARTEWILLDSNIKAAPVYSGFDRTALEGAIRGMKAHVPSHDVAPVFALASSLAPSGPIVFMTDHAARIPADVERIAVGVPFENWGFAGYVVEERGEEVIWQATLKNYSDAEGSRTWSLQAEREEPRSEEIRLPARGAKLLKGVFPAGAGKLILKVEHDQFSLDDTLPMVSPLARELVVSLEASNELSTFFLRYFRAFGGFRMSSTDPDLEVMLAGRDHKPGVKPAIVETVPLGDPQPFDSTPIVSMPHELTDALEWRGLLTTKPPPLKLEKGDEVLLWRGENPLVLLRRGGVQPVLVLNFSFGRSTAARHPAFVLLLHRFMDLVRQGKESYARDNVGLGTLLPLPERRLRMTIRKDLSDLGVEESSTKPLSAPVEPAFFSVHEGNSQMFDGATALEDPTEADMRQVESSVAQRKEFAELVVRNTQEDFLFPLWAMLLLLFLLWLWSIPQEAR